MNKKRTYPGCLLFSFILSVGLFSGHSLEASSSERETQSRFFATKISNRIKIDGVLDEPDWQSAARIPLLYEASPGNNTPARFKTDCIVLFDKINLYFAFIADDPRPEEIRAFISDRDNIQGQDRVAVYLDPFNGARRAYDFTITALGVQFDGIFDQQRGFSDPSWDTIWNSVGKITDTGFVVEASIPFKSLNFPVSEQVQTWGFYAARYRPRNVQVETRSMYFNRNNSCELCQMNRLEGFRDISPGQNLEFTPSITGGRTDHREDVADEFLERGPIQKEAGVDFRWGITSNLTMNATINPDFSQVEADAAQLDINNSFALFFPEKRPFFLEGADFYNTPLQAVFTRTVADPSLGLKFSGKQGRNVFSGLVARDQITNLIIPGNEESSSLSIERQSTVLLSRFRRDVGASSTLGLLYTGRKSDSYSNQVGGFDGFIRPIDPLTINFQYLHSETAYPDSIQSEYGEKPGRFGADAYYVEGEFRKRNWYIRTRHEARSPDFRADAGFIPQVDTRVYRFDVQHFFWGDNVDWFTRINLWAGYWLTENFDGRLTDSYRLLSFQYQGPKQSLVWIFPRWKKRFFDGITYDMFQPFFHLRFRPTGNIFFTLNANIGDAVDFSNSRAADEINLRPDLEVRVGRHLDLGFNYRFQTLQTRGERIFKANLLESRVVYNFNPQTFVRAILQFRQVDRNVGLYVEEVERQSRNVFLQLLFSYKLNPQSVFFLGYSDNRSGLTELDFDKIPLTQTNRSFFMKISYAWRP